MKVCANKFKSFNSNAAKSLLPLCFLVFASGAFSQKLPDEIRGYKVYQAKISVKDDASKTDGKDSEALVKFSDPQPRNVTFSGVSFEISAEISAVQQSGKVDFLTFENFRVNNLPVEIEEYHEPFEISKNKTVQLPKPIQITVGFTDALRGVWREQHDSKDFWQVTGRIFVFGQFKKGFFKFKRVVPVDINLRIKNPIKNGEL